MTDFHARLGLTPGASEMDIRQAFRRQALLMHPDHDDSAGATAQMRALIEARDELLRRLSQRRAIDFDEFLDRVVSPTLDHPNKALGATLARLVNRDPSATIRVTNVPAEMGSP